MTAKGYSMLAACIFMLIAVLQLARALAGFDVVVGSIPIPLAVSWIACIVAGTLALVGFIAARR